MELRFWPAEQKSGNPVYCLPTQLRWPTRIGGDLIHSEKALLTADCYYSRYSLLFSEWVSRLVSSTCTSREGIVSAGNCNMDSGLKVEILCRWFRLDGVSRLTLYKICSCNDLATQMGMLPPPCGLTTSHLGSPPTSPPGNLTNTERRWLGVPWLMITGEEEEQHGERPRFNWRYRRWCNEHLLTARAFLYCLLFVDTVLKWLGLPMERGSSRTR